MSIIYVILYYLYALQIGNYKDHNTEKLDTIYTSTILDSQKYSGNEMNDTTVIDSVDVDVSDFNSNSVACD